MIAARAAALVVLATGCLSKPSFECTFEGLPSSDMARAQLGTAGGGTNLVMDCGTEAFVGLEVVMTAGSVSFQGSFFDSVAVMSMMHCATVSTRGGTYSTGAIRDVAVPGGTYTPTAAPYVANCPSGQVAVGLAANVVINGDLLNSFALDCSAVDESGAPTGSPKRIFMTGTGTFIVNAEASCAAGYVLHGLASANGLLLDRLQIHCGQMTCTPPE